MGEAFILHEHITISLSSKEVEELSQVTTSQKEKAICFISRTCGQYWGCNLSPTDFPRYLKESPLFFLLKNGTEKKDKN